MMHPGAQKGVNYPFSPTIITESDFSSYMRQIQMCQHNEKILSKNMVLGYTKGNESVTQGHAGLTCAVVTQSAATNSTKKS